MKKNEKQNGFDCALNYISYQSRTEKEIEAYLNKKGWSEKDTNIIIEKLKEYNYINDQEYIKNRIQSNFNGDMFGPQRLKRDFIQRGIDEENLACFDQYYTDSMETVCIQKQLEKVQKKVALDHPYKQKEKITAYLQRRGFSWEKIHAAVSQIQMENEKEEDFKITSKTELEHLFQKYYRMQSRKGFEGKELKWRIMNNLRTRGIRSESISEIIEGHSEDFETEK